MTPSLRFIFVRMADKTQGDAFVYWFNYIIKNTDKQPDEKVSRAKS